jgi:hypothetical protein
MNILYKEEKKDYSLLGSYRLITLKNTLAKVLEKVIIDCVRNIAEINRLLP